jgi:hypothetical protein
MPGEFRAVYDERPGDADSEQSKRRCAAGLAQEIRVDKMYFVTAALQETLDLEWPDPIRVPIELADDQDALSIFHFPRRGIFRHALLLRRI